jgi:hypothetical protein
MTNVRPESFRVRGNPFGGSDNCVGRELGQCSSSRIFPTNTDLIGRISPLDITKVLGSSCDAEG